MTSAQAKRLEPLILLFAAGGFVGLIFPLAKLAGNQGLSPLAYAGFSALGASAVLALICRLTGEALPFGQREFHYALVAGQFTFAIPFGTLVAIIPLVGSGVPAILQSLAPIMTLAIVYAAGLESPQAGRMLGLLIGLAGVLLILFSRGAGAEANADLWLWYLIALTTPAALAVGNVYRSTAWPPGCRPMPLATLTLAAAAAGLLALAVIFSLLGLTEDLVQGFDRGWPLVIVQSLCTGIGYAFFFRLQQVGGPVYLSQISYVNTGVGIAFAVLFFGEHLPFTAWLAVGCIFAGVALVTLTGQTSR